MRTPPGGFSAEPGTPDPAAAPSDGGQVPLSPQSSDSPVVVTASPAESEDGTVQAALAASTRAEATLNNLYRAIQQVTAGVSGAREANEQLSSELQRVREMLSASNEQRIALKHQVDLLEGQLTDAARERQFLTDEHDRFIAGLLEEHEELVDRLVREREEANARLEKTLRETLPATAPRRSGTNPGLGTTTAPPPPIVISGGDSILPKDVEKLRIETERSREVLRRLQQQRDEAQHDLARVTEERDKLLGELQKVAPGRVPPPVRQFAPSEGKRTQPAIPTVVQRVTDPSPPDGPSDAEDRVTSPPGEGALAAIAASRPSPSQGTPAQQPPALATTGDSKPPLKRKPDPTAQPLGSYSMTADQLETDRDGTPRRE